MKRLEGIVSEIPMVTVVPVMHKAKISGTAYTPSYYGRMAKFNAELAKEKRFARIESVFIKVGICLTLISFGGFTVIKAMGTEVPPVQWEKTPVSEGDTVWELIKEHNGNKVNKYDMRELVSMMSSRNNQSTNIQAGTVIEIPILK